MFIFSAEPSEAVSMTYEQKCSASVVSHHRCPTCIHSSRHSSSHQIFVELPLHCRHVSGCWGCRDGQMTWVPALWELTVERGKAGNLVVSNNQQHWAK